MRHRQVCQRKPALGGLNRHDLPLIPLALLLSAPWPRRQVPAVIEEFLYLENKALADVEARADLRKVLSRAEL